MFNAGQSVHYWESPEAPAVLCTVLWEGLPGKDGRQILLVQETATGRRITANETRLSHVPLEAARKLGLCPTCHAQPCLCAHRKNPNWIRELEAEINRIHGPAFLENPPTIIDPRD